MPIGPFGLQPPQYPLARFQGPLQPMPTGGTLENVLSSSQGVSDLFGTMRKDSEEEPLKIKTETDPVTGEPKMSVEGLTQKAWSAVMDALSFKARAVAGMQQHADMLAQREAEARANPLLHALSTVAGNLAVSDPRLPPLVSALGRSSLALNPNPDQLARERLGIQEQIGKTAGEAGTLGLGIEQFAAAAQERQLRREEAKKEKQDVFLTHETDKANTQQFDAKAFLQAGLRLGFSAEELIGHAKTLVAAQEAARIRKLTAESEGETRKANVRLAEKRAEIPIDVEKARQVNAVTSAATLGRETTMEGIRQANREKNMNLAMQNRKDIALTNLDSYDKAQLEAVDRLGAQIKRVQATLEAHPEFVNPLQGNVVANKLRKMSNSEAQFLTSLFRDMTATVVQMSGEKTRGFTKYGLEFNRELVPKMTDTLKEISGKIKQLENERLTRFQGIKKVYPKADLSAFDPEGAVSDEEKLRRIVVGMQ